MPNPSSQRFHAREDLLVLREAAFLLLREDLLITERHLEHTAHRRDQRDCVKLLVIILEDYLRQTGGAYDVSSRRTVLDSHLCLAAHTFLLFFHRRFAATVVPLDWIWS